MDMTVLVVAVLLVVAVACGALVVHLEATSVRLALRHFEALLQQTNGQTQRARSQAEGARAEAQSARSEAIVTRSEIQALRELLHDKRDER